MDFEVVQISPEMIYRRVFPDRTENNNKNEYYYVKGGVVSSSYYPTIKEAVEACKKAE